MTDCTYCGCAVEAHDPVFVYEGGDGTARDGKQKTDEREPVGQFCNYGCLSAHVEEAGLADGTRCRLDA